VGLVSGLICELTGALRTLEDLVPMFCKYGRTSADAVLGVGREGVFGLFFCTVSVPYTLFVLKVLSTSADTFLGRGGRNSLVFLGIILLIYTHISFVCVCVYARHGDMKLKRATLIRHQESSPVPIHGFDVIGVYNKAYHYERA
jgi:hypothetical protein